MFSIRGHLVFLEELQRHGESINWNNGSKDIISLKIVNVGFFKRLEIKGRKNFNTYKNISSLK